jgi:arylsulfatase A-like enzyme
VDRIGAYAVHPDPGRTPNIDALAAGGLLFRRAWVNPICSPTRASILTGRYGFRTGVLRVVNFDNLVPPLDVEETVIPEALPAEYSSRAIGKWHLGKDSLTHPNETGFPYFVGSRSSVADDGGNYFEWSKVRNGVESTSDVYATTDLADETLEAMDTLREPWFIYCAFTAVHTPWHEPPAGLHSYDVPDDPGADPPLTYRAMAEALDSEIGRILEELPENTFVIFIGDNGTPKDATDAPFDPGHAKGTMYDGGVNVPLIVAGPGVRVGEDSALVNGTDLFATIMDLSRSRAAAEDSVSFALHLFSARSSSREWIYAERKNLQDVHMSAVRDDRYKLIRIEEARDELYDLKSDPFEVADLLEAPHLSSEAGSARNRLSSILQHLRK